VEGRYFKVSSGWIAVGLVPCQLSEIKAVILLESFLVFFVSVFVFFSAFCIGTVSALG
jgi:hypothetical protein